MRQIFWGILIATLFWFIMFYPFTAQKVNFWAVMFLATFTLGSYSFLSYRKELKNLLKINSTHIFVGVVSAIILYFIFFFGKFITNFLFGFSQTQIQSVYSTKGSTPLWLISILLLLVIGPAEEIFWRGFVLGKLNELNNKPHLNLFISTLLYTFVHIWALNFMLLIAAFVCGLFWGYIFIRYKSLVPGIISHSLWDFAVFILFPFA